MAVIGQAASGGRNLLRQEYERRLQTPVTFRYKDYADHDRTKQMTLMAEGFIRRFLLHVLPKGLVRIQHYGLLAARNVDTKLADCRRLLGDAAQPSDQVAVVMGRSRSVTAVAMMTLSTIGIFAGVSAGVPLTLWSLTPWAVGLSYCPS